MIENLVDNAIAALLQTISGLHVVIGMEDPLPAITTPFCVVYSKVTGYEGRNPVFELLTTIEYETVPGNNTAANIVNVMTSIDTVLSNQPTPAVIATLPLSNLKLLSWQAIETTQQVPDERRRNVRELKVFAQ